MMWVLFYVKASCVYDCISFTWYFFPGLSNHFYLFKLFLSYINSQIFFPIRPQYLFFLFFLQITSSIQIPVSNSSYPKWFLLGFLQSYHLELQGLTTFWDESSSSLDFIFLSVLVLLLLDSYCYCNKLLKHLEA